MYLTICTLCDKPLYSVEELNGKRHKKIVFRSKRLDALNYCVVDLLDGISHIGIRRTLSMDHEAI